MTSTSLAEWVLARVTGRIRAAAIMGDLEELAQARGRRWFFAAYVRTIITLGWRTPIAFLAGYALFQLVASGIRLWLLRNPVLWQNAARSGLFASMGPLVFLVTLAFWFMLPYALIRYGWRDRFVQLTGASTLLVTTAFFYPRLLSVVSALVVAAVTLALLAIPAWRRAVAVLACTVIVGSVIVAAVSFGIAMATIYLSEQLHPGHLFPNQHPPIVIILLLLAVICSSLHARLLRSSEIGGTHAEPA